MGLPIDKTCAVVCLLLLLDVSKGDNSTTAATPPTTKVHYFKCGKGRCEINRSYCDHGGSINTNQWSCEPCSEITQWCGTNIERVPRDCFGYCEAQKMSIMILEEECNKIVKRVKHTHSKETGAMVAENKLTDRDNQSNSNGYMLAAFVVSVLEFAIIIGLLIARRPGSRCRQRQHRVTDAECQRLNSRENETEMGQKKLIVTQPENALTSTGTQTDEMTTPGDDINPHLDLRGPQSNPAFSQPLDPGVEGVRTLLINTVAVNSRGIDSIQDNSYLDHSN